MELRVLNYFLAVAREENITKAARVLHISQPALSRQLRDNKLNALESGKPDAIVTANIGCQTHLDGAGRTPVRHWIEIVEEAMG